MRLAFFFEDPQFIGQVVLGCLEVSGLAFEGLELVLGCCEAVLGLTDEVSGVGRLVGQLVAIFIEFVACGG